MGLKQIILTEEQIELASDCVSDAMMDAQDIKTLNELIGALESGKPVLEKEINK